MLKVSKWRLRAQHLRRLMGALINICPQTQGILHRLSRGIFLQNDDYDVLVLKDHIGVCATISAAEAVNFLLTLGLGADGVTTFNENSLFGPAYRGWNTLLELLIEKGADVNVVSKAGVTPWLAASGFGDRLGGVLYNKAGADILVRHGADPKLGHPCEAQTKCR